MSNFVDNSLSPVFPRTIVVVEMASYPGPDGEDGDGREDEGEDGGPPHPEILTTNKYNIFQN